MASDTAARKFSAYIDVFGDWNTLSPGVRRSIIDYAYGLATSYGEATASLACEMYDALAELQNAAVPPAVPAATATYQETAIAVQGAMKQSQTKEVVSAAVGRLVKQAGADTTAQNAIRDKASWAWIPAGDTCAFCLALASQGWVEASKAVMNGDHAEHIHANCDCTFAVRHDPEFTVAGYHPEEYEEMYYNAPLDGEAPTPKNRINAMRREIYAENKDAINKQKRIAYARRNAQELLAKDEISLDWLFNP